MSSKYTSGTTLAETFFVIGMFEKEGLNEYMNVFNEAQVVPIAKESAPVFTRFPVMAGSKQIPMKLKKLGVRRMYPKALLDEPSIRPYIVDSNSTTEGAHHISQSLITLPTHRYISPEAARRIAHDVREYYQC